MPALFKQCYHVAGFSRNMLMAGLGFRKSLKMTRPSNSNLICVLAMAETACTKINYAPARNEPA